MVYFFRTRKSRKERKNFVYSVYYFPVVSGSATNLRVQIILHASVSLRFYFLGNFLGNLLKFLFQAHKHRKVRLSVLLLPYPPKVCLIACRTISQVPSRKWDLVRICNGIEAESLRLPSPFPITGKGLGKGDALPCSK